MASATRQLKRRLKKAHPFLKQISGNALLEISELYEDGIYISYDRVHTEIVDKDDRKILDSKMQGIVSYYNKLWLTKCVQLNINHIPEIRNLFVTRVRFLIEQQKKLNTNEGK